MLTPLRRQAALVPPLLALAALLPTVPSAAAAPPPAAWQLAAPLPAATADAKAAQLGDGDVLLFGGALQSQSATDASVRYDAATGTWAAVDPMLQLLYDEAVVTLADGRVLISGGSYVSTTADAAIFDPQSDEWTAVAPMATARADHSLTLLADGTVLAAGGRDGITYLSSAERYDPVANRWTTVGSMPSPHARQTATRLADGSVVVVGGHDTPDIFGGVATATVTRFDPASERWTAQPALPRARVGHTATLLEDGTLVVVGGEDGTLPITLRRASADGRWSTLGATTFTRPQTTLLDGGLLLVTSGTETKLLDTRDGTAATVAAAPINRSGGTLLRLPDGAVLRVGGGVTRNSFTIASADVERFDPRAHAVTASTDFGEQTTGRRSATVTVPVTAVGDVPLFVRDVTLEGAAAADFAITADGCSDAVLEEGESCFVGVRFAPGADGARTATLAIAAPLLDDGRELVALTGDGVPAPVIPEIPRTPETPRAPETPTTPQPDPTPTPVVPQPDPTPTPTPAARRPAARRPAATPQIRCGTRKAGRGVTCTGVPRAAGAGSVRLSRNGIVHATGTLKNGRLTLTVRRRLVAGSYTLVVGKRSLKVAVA